MSNISFCRFVLFATILTIVTVYGRYGFSEDQILDDRILAEIIRGGAYSKSSITGKVVPHELFDTLPPGGDYAKLELIVVPKKFVYARGEPIFIKTVLKNTSSTPVNVFSGSNSGFFFDNAIIVEFLGPSSYVIRKWNPNPDYRKAQAEEKYRQSVAMTLLGREERVFAERWKMEYGDHPPKAPLSDKSYFKLPPNTEAELHLGIPQINLLYDMSLPGEYRITYYRTTVIGGQKFDPPLKSNTVEIEVTGEMFRGD